MGAENGTRPSSKNKGTVGYGITCLNLYSCIFDLGIFRVAYGHLAHLGYGVSSELQDFSVLLAHFSVKFVLVLA